MARKGYVYFISDGNGNIKIGVSDAPERRLKELQTGNAKNLRFVHMIETDTQRAAFDIETAIHRELNQYRKEGEWFEEDAVLRYLNRDRIEAGGYVFDGMGSSGTRLLIYTIFIAAVIFGACYFMKMIGV